MANNKDLGWNKSVHPADGECQKLTHRKLYGRIRPVVLVSILRSCFDQDASGSVYSQDTAMAVMNDLVKRASIFNNGSLVAVTTPYRTQLSVLSYTRHHLVRQMKILRRTETANQLLEVKLTTVDEIAGEKGGHILLNTCAKVGRLFQMPRTVVALTRSRDCLTIFGDASTFTDRKESDHPIRKLFRRLGFVDRSARYPGSGLLQSVRNFATDMISFGKFSRG